MQKQESKVYMIAHMLNAQPAGVIKTSLSSETAPFLEPTAAFAIITATKEIGFPIRQSKLGGISTFGFKSYELFSCEG